VLCTLLLVQSQISCTVCVSKKTSGKKLISHRPGSRYKPTNFLSLPFTITICCTSSSENSAAPICGLVFLKNKIEKAFSH
jgi:hypothetical protein